jgi:uncharacterized iron-regulated membrane protein
VHNASLHREPESAWVFYLNRRITPTGEKLALPDDQIYIDPYTGAVLGVRQGGAISQGWLNLMPFIYELHYQLALGTVGTWAFGIVALLWTIDCFVGAYLTFPARQRKSLKEHQPKGSTWLSRWWKSWKIRWHGGSNKVNFDLHRAGGLWLWAMLFVIAWSSVAFNLRQVYEPVMHTLFDTQPGAKNIAKLAKPQENPQLSWSQGLEIGRTHMAQLAKQKAFIILRDQQLRYDPQKALFTYRAKTSRDIRDHYGSTSVTFDANYGKLIATYLPTGAASGDTITTCLLTLHMAAIWGLPFKVFMTLMGLTVTMLSITGLIIWLKKRKSRRIIKLQRVI